MPEPIAPTKPQIETKPEIKVVERYKPTFALEHPHRVIIHNDDVTTFEFVISILIAIFKQTPQRSSDIAWETHTKGLAFVCSLPAEEARRKVNAAHEAARANHFPLRFTIEPGWLGN